MSTLSELPIMFRKLFPLAIMSGVIVLSVSNPAKAVTPLTKAVVQDLHNLVQLMPRNKPKRKAQLSDAIIPGDGLSTGRSSLADLRFNDGSLARVGEQAVFQFLPKTRNFTLNNGTVLLLIPPGRGRTNIRTPSAAAAIRGSALFVRYDKATDTTVIGALTNSGIEVINKDASGSQVLKAGQVMVVVKGKFERLYDFDLRKFYETSGIVRGLDLTRQSTNAIQDPALDSVRVETSEALAKQPPVTGPGTIQNPSFVKLTPTDPEATDVTDATSAVVPVKNQAEILPDTLQIESNNPRNNRVPNNKNSGGSGNENINTSNPSVIPPIQETPTPKPETPTPKPEIPVTPPSDSIPDPGNNPAPDKPSTPFDPSKQPPT